MFTPQTPSTYQNYASVHILFTISDVMRTYNLNRPLFTSTCASLPCSSTMPQAGSKPASEPSKTANLPERLEKIEKRLAAIEATLDSLRKQPSTGDERRNQLLDAIYQAVTGRKPSDQP